MTLSDEHAQALALLHDHPGWSDGRVARRLTSKGHAVSRQSVNRWRIAAGLAPVSKRQREKPRLPGVQLACGHLVHPERVTGEQGHCIYCSGWFRVVP